MRAEARPDPFSGSSSRRHDFELSFPHGFVTLGRVVGLVDKESVKATLRAHEPELRSSGIVHLRLHGSVVRGEAGPTSDVDLAAVFDRNIINSPLAEIRLARQLSMLLGATVDLTNEPTLKPDVRANFEREAESVF